jgi:hypothetical protein
MTISCRSLFLQFFDFSFFGQRAEGQGRGALLVQACCQQVLREIHPTAGRGAQE